jgi:hypothetical protein
MIFISYSSADRMMASYLHRGFVARGVCVWIDYLNLDLKRDIETQIATAVRESKSLLLIASPDSVSSPWVQFELSVCLRYRKPVLLMPARPHFNRSFSVPRRAGNISHARV